MKKQIDIFTDGACRGNPGPGGWGALIRFEGVEKELSGYSPDTTNNRMELLAPIMALESLDQAYLVHITTDSQYVKKGMTEWLVQWKRRGWRTASNKPVKNVDLWIRLAALADQHEILWHWVRGHSGHHENERVDQVANAAITAGLQQPADE